MKRAFVSTTVLFVVCGIAGVGYWASHEPVLPNGVERRRVEIRSMNGGVVLRNIFDGARPNPRAVAAADSLSSRPRTKATACARPNTNLSTSGKMLTQVQLGWSKVADLAGLTPWHVKAQSGCLECYAMQIVDVCPGYECWGNFNNITYAGGYMFGINDAGRSNCGDPWNFCPVQEEFENCTCTM